MIKEFWRQFHWEGALIGWLVGLLLAILAVSALPL